MNKKILLSIVLVFSIFCFFGNAKAFTTAENKIIEGIQTQINQILVRLIALENKINPSITIVSPNGGETLEIGKTYDIAWISQGFSLSDTVVISINDERFDLGYPTGSRTIIKTTNSGLYSWTIPSQLSGYDITPGNKYRIVVLINGLDTGRDVSDNVFSISNKNASKATTTPLTHNVCSSERCTVVSGAGADQCKLDSDCSTASTILKCKNLSTTITSFVNANGVVYSNSSKFRKDFDLNNDKTISSTDALSALNAASNLDTAKCNIYLNLSVSYLDKESQMASIADAIAKLAEQLGIKLK